MTTTDGIIASKDLHPFSDRDQFMKGIILITLLFLFCSFTIYSQPRPVERSATPTAAASYPARYEGGIFGASSKDKGTLRFDDANERVSFYREDGREMFSIPFDAITVVYPDSKVSMSQTGNVISRLPLPGAGLAGLHNKRAQFVIINFEDSEIDAKGVANFKFEDKKLLMNFIDALGAKAKLKQRGDAYYRAKTKSVY
jgi:hypothetical protein